MISIVAGCLANHDRAHSRGAGGEGKASGHGQKRRSLDDTHFQTVPFCYILYVEQWGFLCSMSSGHHTWGPRSSIALGRTRVVQVSTTRRPSPRIEDGEGVVPPRSTTDSTECLLYVICLFDV